MNGSLSEARDSEAIRPFRIEVPQAQIDDLKDRLRRVRLPEAETVDGWRQGVPLADMRSMCRAWLDDYDWRAVEAELNGAGQWQTRLDGLDIQFLHARSSRPDARPLLISHGWPGSMIEFLDILPHLTEPPPGEPAFHVVVPSLPGFAFSEKPARAGWGLERISDAWAELMTRLDYGRFLATGGDWGAMITTTLAIRHPDRLAMMHTVVPWAVRPAGFSDADLSETEARWLREIDEGRARRGHGQVQSVLPQTFGYGLVDSPAGQLAWILEAYLGHADRGEDGACLVPIRRMLDGAAVYWFTASGASSARLYWESLGKMDLTTPVVVPAAVSVFPKEMQKLPKSWVEKRYTDLRYWNELDRGGHFAMLEVPELYISELRAAFACAD